MDFTQNAADESRAGGSGFLDAMAADSHRDFQYDQRRDSPLLCGGDGAGGGGTRRYQSAVPVGCVYQTQTICVATAGAGRRDGSDHSDYPRLYWGDDVADVDSGPIGPGGDDWIINQPLRTAPVAAKLGNRHCPSCLHTCSDGLYSSDSQRRAHW